MKTLLFLIILLCSALAHAQNSKSEFCEAKRTTDKIVQSLRHWDNLVGIANNSGLLGLATGVCWWHSRFQRNAAYLVKFDPSAPKPSNHEARQLIKKIISGKEVVTIPGYRDLRLFTVQYSQELQGALNAWMNRDTFLGMKWINGLKGPSSMSPNELQNHLYSLEREFKETDGILYLTLQTKGVSAHSWLLTGIQKISGGWNLSIIDSLAPLATHVIFLEDDATSMIPSIKHVQNQSYHRDTRNGLRDRTAIGYVNFKSELERVQQVQRDYCLD